jgi:multimeric flavodoxin WrbA
VDSDGILLGSPTYFSDITAGMKAFMERVGMVARVNGNLFQRKVGAGMVTVRRAGAIHALDSLNHFFLIGGMILVGSSYWNVGVGRNIGEVQNDSEGMETMSNLGKNIAWLLQKIKQE